MKISRRSGAFCRILVLVCERRLAPVDPHPDKVFDAGNAHFLSYLIICIDIEWKRLQFHSGRRPLDSLAMFEQSMEEHLKVIQALRRELPVMQQIAEKMSLAILEGHKILWCGNGGSAADSQHLAAEFVGRFLRERRALPSIALTTNTSVLTAIGNDYGYDLVFRRQVEAICTHGDVLVGISTSGNSKNVLNALTAGREMRAFTVAFVGATGGAIAEIADASIKIPSTETPRIQEGHILCGHMICDYVENRVCQAQTVEHVQVSH